MKSATAIWQTDQALPNAECRQLVSQSVCLFLGDGDWLEQGRKNRRIVISFPRNALKISAFWCLLGLSKGKQVAPEGKYRKHSLTRTFQLTPKAARTPPKAKDAQPSPSPLRTRPRNTPLGTQRPKRHDPPHFSTATLQAEWSTERVLWAQNTPWIHNWHMSNVHVNGI